MLFDFIELKGNDNLYIELYEKIRSAISDNIIKVGEKLPSVREAASQLNVSRTTVENAYSKLCIEGFVESYPQKGYFVIDNHTKVRLNDSLKNETLPNIEYDFSSRRIDTENADIKTWKKTVRQTLLYNEELTSYGDSQGEYRLRKALSEYSYKARGVKANPENIVIAAGIGPLLNILCGLLGRNVKVGFSSDGFEKAENLFCDYGISTHLLESDISGATLKAVTKNDIDVLFLTPSSLSKISRNALSKRRSEYSLWANKSENRWIIEDDYNGELRFTARSIPAFQGTSPQKTVYIGSFSKLLLPSVRLAFMVLPDFLAEKFKSRKSDFNQTCGKIDQLSLTSYIKSGNLEKHLRRLRRLYYAKSKVLLEELEKNFPESEKVLFESLLTVRVFFGLPFSSKELTDKLLENKICVIENKYKGSIDLCFSGIRTEEIEKAITKIKEVIES